MEPQTARHIIPARYPKAVPCGERFEPVSARFRSCRGIAARQRRQTHESTFLAAPPNSQPFAGRVLATARRRPEPPHAGASPSRVVPRTRKSACPKSTQRSRAASRAAGSPAPRGRRARPPSPPPALHVPPHGGAGAPVAALRDQPVVDPPGGVALLAPAAPVLPGPRVDRRRVRLEQGRCRGPPDPGRPLGQVRLPQVPPHRGLRDPGVPGDRGDARPASPELSDIVDLVHADHFLPGLQSSRRIQRQL